MPQPVAFYPLSARYKASEKENRQPEGILEDVAITNGPYNEPGGAYMFYGTDSSYIGFPNRGGLDTRFSITLMCWVQPGHYNGSLISYGFEWESGVQMWIADGKFYNQIKRRNYQSLTSIRTAEVFQQESGFMLQQVTITTPGITRCISTDILESRKTLAKVMRLQPPRTF